MIDFSEVLKSLLRAKWIIIGVTLISMISAFGIKFYGDKKYESEAQLSTGITTNDGLVENRGYINAYEINLTFSNLIENLKSRLILSQLSYSLLLHDLNKDNIPFRGINDVKIPGEISLIDLRLIIKSKYDNFEILRPDDPDDILINSLLEDMNYDDQSIADELVVYRVNSTDYISILFTSENPFLSAYIVNALCQEYIRYYKNQYENVTSSSLESLKEIADSKKSIFDQKFEELRQFKDANKLIGSGENNSDLVAGQVLEYERLIEEERIKIEGLELSIANIDSKLDNRSNKKTDNSYLLEIEKKIKSLNEAYLLSGNKDQVLLDSLTALRELKIVEQNKISRARTDVEDLPDLLDRKNQFEMELQLANSNLNYLQNRYNSLTSSLNSYSGIATTLNSLENEVETSREDYQEALKKYNDLKDESSIYRLKIKQVLFGEPAENPDFVDIISFPIFAGFLSFFLGVSVVVFFELIDNRVKNEERFERLTGLRTIQGIPKIKKPKNNIDYLMRINQKNVDIDLMQAIRKIRFEIENLDKRVFTITSFNKKEGKSFTIASLAYALSVLNKKILIIDTNFQSNFLTKYFNAKPAFELLCEEISRNPSNFYDPDTNTIPMKYFKEIRSGIYLLGSKNSTHSPREILSNYNFDLVLKKFTEQFNYVFLEGAALNDYSDVKELEPYSESIIPIVSSKSEFRKNDKDVVTYLHSLDGKLGPVLLNNI